MNLNGKKIIVKIVNLFGWPLVRFGLYGNELSEPYS